MKSKLLSQMELNKWWKHLSGDLKNYLRKELGWNKLDHIDQHLVHNLKSLWITKINISDFSDICIFSNLEQVQLLEVTIEKGFEKISSLVHLVHLNLVDVEFTQLIATNVLRNNKNIEKVWISGGTPLIIFQFDELINLKELEWNESDIDQLPELPNNLQKLYIEDTKISDLSPLIKLKDSLSFVYCHKSRISYDHYIWIKENMPNTQFQTSRMIP